MMELIHEGAMKYEPAIDHARLLATIRAAYGLPAEALQFVPVGFAAVCYIVQCTDGTQRFLKLWLDSADPLSIARHERILRLLRAIHDRHVPVLVPVPLATRGGKLWTTCAGTPFALFPYLDGNSPPWPCPRPTWDNWARTMATIHRATPLLADVLPPHETFAIDFEADLHHMFVAAEQIGPDARPGLRTLRDMLCAERSDILAQLARLYALQRTVRHLPGPRVLCHTDLGSDNLLVDAHGQISVLDWDEATVAPPEHDLHEARFSDLGRFLDVYMASGGARPFHLEHFAFYLLRRHLGDMMARVQRMLTNNLAPDEDADALHGIEAWGFAQWRALDRTLEQLGTALRDHGHPPAASTS